MAAKNLYITEMLPSAHVLRLYPDVWVYGTKRPRSEYSVDTLYPKVVWT